MPIVGLFVFPIVRLILEAVYCIIVENKKYGAKKFGIHMMTGSCVLSNAYWIETVTKMLDTVAMLRAELNIEFEYINVGGGIGIPYKPEIASVDIPQLVKSMREVFDKKIVEHNMPEPILHMENGRYMTGPFGYLVSRCQAMKDFYHIQVSGKSRQSVGSDP